MLLPSFPLLSDDIFRFFWDGLLLRDHIHPLNLLPGEVMQLDIDLSDYGFIYDQLNSPNYYTIYPPISQLIFYLSIIFGAFGVSKSALILKIILFLFEIGTFYLLFKLLRKFNKPIVWLGLYALNPLVIVEIMSNVHFEGVMACFVLGAFYLLFTQRVFLSGTSLALGVGAKLLPLMFLPAILLYILKVRYSFMKFVVAFMITSMALFIPFLLGVDFTNFGSSLDLYFQKFEFNAGLYYLVRSIGELLTGYNQIRFIGPLLSVSALIIILAFARRMFNNPMYTDDTLIDVCLLSFMTYLLFATTVHPWYLIMPLALMVFRPRLWILVWSYVIIFSYSRYSTPDFAPKYIWVTAEYVIILMAFIYEKVKSKNFTIH